MKEFVWGFFAFFAVIGLVGLLTVVPDMVKTIATEVWSELLQSGKSVRRFFQHVGHF